MNPRGLHLSDLRLGYSIVNRRQKEPQSFRPFCDDLAPPLPQGSLGCKDDRILWIPCLSSMYLKIGLENAMNSTPK